MSTPTLNYSIVNGSRSVTVNGVKLNTDRLAAPVGTHDIKTTPAGVKLISIAGDLHEPYDIAEALGKV